jgi:hypothetical protein
VYDVEGLNAIPNVRYVGKEVNITGDPLTYIQTHQTGKNTG